MFFLTVALVSPFIGLFGTVWSVIKNFINFFYGYLVNFVMISSGIAELISVDRFRFVCSNSCTDNA